MKQLQENAFFGEYNRYRLVRLLGKYTSAEVWIADDTQTGSIVALKLYVQGADGAPNIRYEVFEQMPCLLMPTVSGVWSPDENRLVEGNLKVEPSNPKNNARKLILAAAAVLLLGLFAGYFAGSANSKPDTNLQECIRLIEQGDELFSDADKTTWMKVLAKYRQAKELIDQYTLPLPNMEPRISHLQEKIDSAIRLGIETAKIFYDGGSPSMAVSTLENEVLKINPEHIEGNELLQLMIDH